MAKEKQPLKSGEKILFGIIGVFIVLAFIAYIALEAYRLSRTEPLFKATTSYDFTEEGLLGSRLFREQRCTSCHRAPLIMALHRKRLLMWPDCLIRSVMLSPFLSPS